MPRKKGVAAHSARQQKEYERIARLQYGPDLVNESIQRWNNYTKAQQAAIQAEGGQVYLELKQALEAGIDPHSSEVQAILPRWHDNIRHFYEPTLEILRGLGETYQSEPGFIAFFQKFHPNLPGYLAEAITQYVDDLEYAEIALLLAEEDMQAKTARLAYRKEAS